MKRPVFLLPLLLLLCASAAPTSAAEITGEIYIATDSSFVIRLPLVDIALCDAATVSRFIAQRKADAVKVVDYFGPVTELAEKTIETATAVQRARAETAKEQGIEKLRAAYEAGGSTAEKRPEPGVKRQQDGAEQIAQIARTASHSAALGRYPLTAQWYFDDLPKALQTVTSDANGRFKFSVPDGSYILAARASRKVAGSTDLYHWLIRIDATGRTAVKLDNRNLSTAGSRDSLITTLHYDPESAWHMREHDAQWLIDFVEAKTRELAAAKK